MASRLRRRIGTYFSAAGSVAGTTGGGAVGTGITNSSGQLSSGHWYSSVGTFFSSLYAVYPRPDSETNTWARHRWAYYDGVNSIPYQVELGVQFGGWPYWYELITGPSGMTIGQVYGDTNYGIVTWTPTGSVSNQTVTVRVHDQDGNTLDVTWTVSTSSSTSQFMFLSPSGNNANAGTISSPKQTLQGAFGATEGGTTYPGRILYLRAGSYAAYDQGAGYGFQVNGAKTPGAIIGYPGETATITQATAGSECTINCTTGMHDLFFKNLTFTGNPTTTNFYSIRAGELQNRLTFDSLSFPNAYKGSAAYNNASCIYFNSTGTSARANVFINRCSVTNFGATGGGGNAWGLACLFTTGRILVANCSDTANAGERILTYLKASCQNAEIRECYGTTSSVSAGIMTGVQPDLSLNQGPTLIRHNRVNAGATGSFIVLDESQTGSSGSLIKEFYVVRNSGIGSVSANGGLTGSYGPYVIAENVMQTSNNLVTRNYANTTLGSYTTSSNNVGGSSGWLDSVTLNLQSGHLNVRGTRGAEIA